MPIFAIGATRTDGELECNLCQYGYRSDGETEGGTAEVISTQFVQ